MKKPMCIAIFGPLPSSKNVGGPETITYNLARALGELGNRIYIFKGFFGSRIDQNNTKVYDIVHPDAIKESQVFHVILGLKSGGYIGAFLAKALGKPLITHFHQPPDRSFKGIKDAKFTFLNFLSPLDRNLLKTSDKVISVSDYSKNMLFHMYGIDSVVIPPGVDRTFFANSKDPQYFSRKYCLKNDELRILFVGHLIPRKGVEFLIRAFQKVNHEVQDSSLVIVGDGVDKNRLMKLTTDLNLSDVHFLGRIPQTDLRHAYASSHVFVLPSVEEGFGIVLLEAMACGLPVIASKTTGVLDIIADGRTGILFPPRDVKQLSEALVILLNDEQLRIKLGKTAQKYAERNFDWRMIAQKIEDVYSAVIR